MTTQKKILITSALPYANGPLHFGHLAGAYLPADVITRHRKMEGHKVIHISGSDEHGVAIMLNAQKVKRPYKEYVNEWHKSHKELFDRFEVAFDFFGQTSADYHYEEVVKWFKELHAKGFIGTKDEQQLYCNDCKNFLPDRFVQGTCYICGYAHARGDECPECGTWIEPNKLKNPVCQICGGKDHIEIKTSTQYYLLLSKYHKEFRQWFEEKKGEWRNTVWPYVDSLSKEGLHDRAISRDLDWGIDVPLPEAKGKKLYVWFDAPIGYVSNTKKLMEQNGNKEDYLKDWWQNKDVELVHFIGKDNIIFHTIIFPVMSMASGCAKPATDVPANQYLNLAGKQFSKSQGWYVDAEKAIGLLGPDALRYYLISIIPENSDSSFTWEGFQAKVNGELANNIGNLVARCLKFWAKNWPEGMDAKYFADFVKSEECKKLSEGIKEHVELLDKVEIRKGLDRVMALGQVTNTFFSDRAPWAQVKVDKEAAAKTIAETSMQILVLGILLAPYLPTLSGKLLSHFENVTDERKKRIYAGDLSVLADIFGAGMKLQGTPDILVPKIEDKLIAELQAELEGKK